MEPNVTQSLLVASAKESLPTQVPTPIFTAVLLNPPNIQPNWASTIAEGRRAAQMVPAYTEFLSNINIPMNPIESRATSRAAEILEPQEQEMMELIPPQRPAEPPVEVRDLSDYYFVPEQSVRFVHRFGPAFIHILSGTAYTWVEALQKFTTMDGWAYEHLWAPEYGLKNRLVGAVVDNRLRDDVSQLPVDFDLPNRFVITSALGDGLQKF